MKIKDSFLAVVFFCTCLAGCGSREVANVKLNALVPQPVHIEVQEQSAFLFDNRVAIVAEGECSQNSETFLRDYLKKYYGIEPRNRGRRAVELSVQEDTAAVEGAYRLEVDEKGIKVIGYNEPGLFYGVQTLLQLFPAGKDREEVYGKNGGALPIPSVKIEDAPAYGYRGMHLDVARHFMPVEFVKEYIDYLAMHKMNHFHWHLTDDQGWRIESRKHPQLNEVGSYRDATIIGIYPGTGIDSTRYGGYYRVEELKEVVEYAAKRYITIVPEIDLPGHCMAILATYPHFGTEDNAGVKTATTWGIFNKLNNVLAPSEEVFGFLEDVFNELMDIFPGKYIHIGADECAHKWWKNSPKTQQFMQEHDIADERGLQKYFAVRVSDMVKRRGRIAVGWDEMVDNGLPEDAVVMVWRSYSNWKKAAEQGHKLIMTPSIMNYFNRQQRPDETRLAHRGRPLTLEIVYNQDPTPDSLAAVLHKNIIGGQGCMWTEYYHTPEEVEYAIFPRMSAVAEVFWTCEDLRDYGRFLAGMPDMFARYELWGVEPCRYIFEEKPTEPDAAAIK